MVVNQCHMIQTNQSVLAMFKIQTVQETKPEQLGTTCKDKSVANTHTDSLLGGNIGLMTDVNRLKDLEVEATQQRLEHL